MAVQPRLLLMFQNYFKLEYCNIKLIIVIKLVIVMNSYLYYQPDPTSHSRSAIIVII